MMILNCDNESVLLQSFYSSVLSQIIFILLYVCFYFNNALCCVLMKTINDLKLKLKLKLNFFCQENIVRDAGPASSDARAYALEIFVSTGTRYNCASARIFSSAN